MKLSLVVLNAGKASGQTIPVPAAEFVIGRDPKCNLRPASAMISKQHCALLVKDGKVTLRDFGSTNGTFVNEKPVKGDLLLAHGDLLKVGPLTFRVAIEGAAAERPTPPPPTAPTMAKVGPRTAAQDDDDAALMLAMDDDGPGPAVEVTTDESDVPAGSTIMDMPAILLPQAADDKPTETAKKPEPTTEKKPEAKPSSSINAQSAARDLLDKMRRGNRR